MTNTNDGLDTRYPEGDPRRGPFISPLHALQAIRREVGRDEPMMLDGVPVGQNSQIAYWCDKALEAGPDTPSLVDDLVGALEEAEAEALAVNAVEGRTLYSLEALDVIRESLAKAREAQKSSKS